MIVEVRALYLQSNVFCHKEIFRFQLNKLLWMNALITVFRVVLLEI